jgi:N-acetylated-alpha-linked acidic dipeptidase
MRVSHLLYSLSFLIVLLPGVVIASPPDDWEKEFRKLPDPERMKQTVKYLSAHAHHVGSPHDKTNAEWILARFKEYGLEARIETFDVLFPTPVERTVELVKPHRFVASLKEPALQEDPTSGQQDEQLPSYNAYSADGDVTAPLVYVNFGLPEDYDRLEEMGISAKGAMVIARYGGSWRGIKPKVAAEHGAIGCLIYSDPRGDGYFQGDVYPRGAWRPPDGVQRGSVADMPVYPGDPLTPGIPATKDAKRLPLSEARTITRIPVLPLSYADAKPLLEALGGPVAPDQWRGSLPITYHVGPGPAIVHLKVKCSWDLKTIYDVIARIEGSEYPDEWVIRGNHHDAWVFGAEDPLSGLAPLLEEARAFGQLLKQGWRPKRTIVVCAWDGEEEGLLGSTEWVEAHELELRDHAVLYINSDSNGRGYLGVSGSHSLEHFINEVARDIIDPETNLTVWKRVQLRRIADAESVDDRAMLRQHADLRISALGSGSDYTAFLGHVGVASLNLGYGGEGGGGIYHSIYDSYSWYTRFSDTNFLYGRTLAQTAGTALLRSADAEVLPYRFINFGDAVRLYVEELQQLLKKSRENTAEKNREIEEGVYAAIADPREVSIPPSREGLPPFLNFAPIENALVGLERACQRYDKAASRWKAATPEIVRKVNELLLKTERVLTTRDGLPGRPWFRHQIYAPGAYTGYGVKTLPAVREAIELKHWNEANDQIPRVATVLEAETAILDSASTTIEAAPHESIEERKVK